MSVYGIYVLLKEADCAFVYPGADEEIVPSSSTLTFKVDQYRENPSIEYRGLALYGLQASSLELGHTIIDWIA